MTVSLRVMELAEPELEFGNPSLYWPDPKVGLLKEGPFSARFGNGQPDRVRVGIVGNAPMVDAARRWFERCQGLLLSRKENRRRFPDFPGFAEIFRTPLEMSDRWVSEISALNLARALALPEHLRLPAVVDLYAEGVGVLARRELGPNVVICSLPREILEKCAVVARQDAASTTKHVRRPRVDDDEQLALPLDFLPDASGEEEEHLVYRTFRRALKARIMVQRHRLPIQIAHDHLFEDGPNKDDPATRAWSVSVGLYYKAGGIPWRLANQQPHVCFIGVSFHRLVTNRRNVMYASLAQAFSSEIEGFVLRGERILPGDDRQPHLTAIQAERLGRNVLEQYRERAGRAPLRVTFHKTSGFEPAESEGFRAAFSEVPSVELVTLQPSELRLLTSDDYPPRRGTLCSINDAQYLYTTGFYEEWGTYPGPHVPAPYRVHADGDHVDRVRVCEETLSLTKMNWNSAHIGGRDPITLEMAGKVGPIMAEVPEEEDPEMSFRYYM